MKRGSVTEKQRKCALLLAAGQHSYREIGQMIGAHYNSISSWARDAQIQDLVTKFQSGIENKLEQMSIEATRRKHDRLIVQAVEKLETMLTSKSTRRQLEAIKVLLTYGQLLRAAKGNSHKDPRKGSSLPCASILSYDLG